MYGPSWRSCAKPWQRYQVRFVWFATFIFGLTASVLAAQSPPRTWSLGLGAGSRQLWNLLTRPPNAQEYMNATYVPFSFTENGSFYNATTPYNACNADKIGSSSFWENMLPNSNSTNTTYSSPLHLNNTVSMNLNFKLTLQPDWDRIWTFGNVPPTFPCPKAWKDPLADYVWCLA